MLHTARSFNGMIVTPHRLATGTGLAVLRKGGNAVEAAVAAAATLCVVYPHMTGLGGDAFWLVLPGQGRIAGEQQSAEPYFIDACGRSAQMATSKWYSGKGLSAVPERGPLAAMTMAGAVSGWEAALQLPLAGHSSGLQLEDLFQDAVEFAERGFPVTSMQSAMTRQTMQRLKKISGFEEQFLSTGSAPEAGERMRIPDLGRTLQRLAKEGLGSFYHGSLADDMAAALEAAGSPLRKDDFEEHTAQVGKPLALQLQNGTVYNSPPPTQGISSLIILGLVERLMHENAINIYDESCLVHAIVESTKQAFILRDSIVADPASMDPEYGQGGLQKLLQDDVLAAMRGAVSVADALPWPTREPGNVTGGDTVWFGVQDVHGNTVSCIQSIYHEFGSGLVLPNLGVTWHNRGLGFRFTPGHPNSLAPGKKPFHTLNPALAIMNDGRTIAYGTMGGEGQPQTQAAIFSRYLWQGHSLQDAVVKPRWLLGRSWGEQSDTLKVEATFGSDVVENLKAKGHTVETVPGFSSLMGHAGILVRHANGLLEGAFDPRSDGSAGCL